MARRSELPLFVFGNHSLQNQRYQVTMNLPRPTPPQVVQKMPIPMGSGSALSNLRLGERQLSINGGITGTATGVGQNLVFQKYVENYNSILMQGDRWLRTVHPEAYKELFVPVLDASPAQIALSGLATGLSQDQRDFQYDNVSYKFSTGAATVGNVTATIDLTLPTTFATELGTGAGSFVLPSIDGWLRLPDVSKIASLELRYMQDASKYYTKTITTNFEDLGLENGWNLLSEPFWEQDGLRTTPGWMKVSTPALANLVTLRVIITLVVGTPALSDWGVDAWFVTEDLHVRNYPCVVDGQTTIASGQYNAVSSNISYGLCNHTGYSHTTHDETKFSQDSITSLIFEKDVFVDGNTNQLPTSIITIVSQVNLNKLRIHNLTTDERLDFSAGDTPWAANDIVTFSGIQGEAYRNGQPQDDDGGFIPTSQPGWNRYRYQAITGSVQTINQLVKDTTQAISINGSGVADLVLGQQFVTTTSGTLPTLKVAVDRVNPACYPVILFGGGGGGSSPFGGVLICSDNGSGLPNFASPLWEGEISSATPSDASGFLLYSPNLTIANATRYHIVVRGYGGGSNLNSVAVRWHRSNADLYASNVRTQSTNGGTSFSLVAAGSGDYAFVVEQEPTPSINLRVTQKTKRIFI